MLGFVLYQTWIAMLTDVENFEIFGDGPGPHDTELIWVFLHLFLADFQAPLFFVFVILYFKL